MRGDRRRSGSCADRGSDVEVLLGIDQVARVLLGREPDHHAQAVPARDVEQRARRHRVRDAHRVDSRFGHLREVAIDLCEIGVLILVHIGPERAVCHAADVELLRAREQELPERRQRRSRLRRGRHSERSQVLREDRFDRGAH